MVLKSSVDDKKSTLLFSLRKGLFQKVNYKFIDFVIYKKKVVLKKVRLECTRDIVRKSRRKNKGCD